jgi:hypothetical protein
VLSLGSLRLGLPNLTAYGPMRPYDESSQNWDSAMSERLRTLDNLTSSLA